jgi:hypothetical protein
MARKVLIGDSDLPTLGTMSRQLNRPSSQISATALKATASWLSLVAATTAGMGPTSMVRTCVRADVADNVGELRLVVHSYAPGQLGRRTVPSAADKPMSSTQRAVTAEELRRGVVVDMIQPKGPGGGNRPVVVAWVEHGRPDLDFDALLARPRPGVPRGCAKARGEADSMEATVELTAA